MVNPSICSILTNCTVLFLSNPYITISGELPKFADRPQSHHCQQNGRSRKCTCCLELCNTGAFYPLNSLLINSWPLQLPPSTTTGSVAWTRAGKSLSLSIKYPVKGKPLPLSVFCSNTFDHLLQAISLLLSDLLCVPSKACSPVSYFAAPAATLWVLYWRV